VDVGALPPVGLLAVVGGAVAVVTDRDAADDPD
jgi:hypothetical protein